MMVLTLNLNGCASAKNAGNLPAQSQLTTDQAEQNLKRNGDKQNLGADDFRVWTDSLGREVSLPETVERVALAGPLAQIVLYALAPEKLVGYSSDWTADEEQFIPVQYRNLPYLGQLYGGKGEMNLEELLAAAPDVVIDIGQPKDSMAEELDALSEQTGIPFVHVTMTLDHAGEAFRMLGDLLSLEERAEEYAEYCENIFSRAKDIVAKVEVEAGVEPCIDGKVSEGNSLNENSEAGEMTGSGAASEAGGTVGCGRKKALYVLGPDGLNVIARDSYHSELMDLFTENLAVLPNPSSKGTGNEVDMEQILKWNPEVIIFGPGSICQDVQNRPEWQSVQAIADGQYYQVPFGPYNWMGFPPSVQCCLGMLWLPQMLYPEYCDYDLKTEVVKYYQMFYHCELGDAQYERLIHP